MNYERIERAADALKHQKQCDPDGIMCQVSRQAVDETRENVRLLLDVARASQIAYNTLAEEMEREPKGQRELHDALTALKEH